MDAQFDTWFLHARDLESPAERDAFLDEVCAGDAKLRARLETRLIAEAEASAYFGEAVTRIDHGARTIIPGEQSGALIGNYKLLEKLGEGGFGTVWMADQHAPVRRRVALKIIKPGLDTKEVIARFEQERQALAMMDHTNIARVFDAGATQSGRPYFVMELVRGVRITDYCDEHGFSIPERIRLFAQVCHAVHHAHQKGIIHRDIKPSNVLVTVNDGKPVVKVIDFGVAKATQGPLTDATLFTQFHQMIGTPAYMSPEQADMTSLDIDTRSDIYSLGVLLYELITGGTPIDSASLARAGLDEIRRVIREVTPAKPSARVKTLSAELLTTTAKRRRTDGAKLTTSLRGDLDWIVMMCLEKDRKRRYDSANALALDLDRYLGHGIVTARPPTASYLMGRIVRRHRVAFAAGAAIALSLLAGLAVSTWLFFKEKAAVKEQSRLRVDAEAARKQEEGMRVRAETGEKTAKTESARSEEITRFLKEMLEGVKPSVALGRDSTMLLDILDATVARLDTELKQQPEVEAGLRSIIGRVYRELARDDKAEPVFRRELELRKQIHGAEHLDVAIALDDLGLELKRQSKFREAEAICREALAMKEKLLGNEHQEVATTLNNLGLLLRDQGKPAEAEKMLRKVVDIRRSVAGEGRDISSELNNLASTLTATGKLTEAEGILRESLAERKKRLGDNHPSVASSLSGLGRVLQNQGKTAEAEQLYRQTLDMRRKLFGNDHPLVADSLNDLAIVLTRPDQLPDAVSALRESLAIKKNRLGDNHDEVAIALNNLGVVLRNQGKLQEAEPLLREALAIHRANWGDQHPFVSDSLTSLGSILTGLGRAGEAEPLLREAVSISVKVRGDAHSRTLRFRNDFASVLASLGKLAEAEREIRALLAIEREGKTGNASGVPERLNNLADVIYRQGRYAEAEPFYRELIEILTANGKTADLDGPQANLGRLLSEWAWTGRETDPLAASRAREGETLLRAAWAGRLNSSTPEHWRTDDVRGRLGFALTVVAATDVSLPGDERLARLSEAEALLIKGNERLQSSKSADTASKRAVVEELVRLYETWDRLAPKTGKAAKAAELKKRLADFGKTAAASALPAP